MMIPILSLDRRFVVCLKPAGADAEKDMPALLKDGLSVREVFCVHRLDKAVGGVMVYALDRGAAAALSAQMSAGRFQKEYRAVVHGVPETAEDTLRDLLFYDRTRGKSFVVMRKRAGVKEASLSYRLLEERDGLSLLSVRLHTGRTHQIRVQLASRRLPLVGDGKYGSPRRDCPIALWSHELGFANPETGEALHFAAPPPSSWPWTIFQIEENKQ